MSTSVTQLLVMIAMLLYGGVTIRPFILAMLVGLVSGTYSSIFNASMLLVVWERRGRRQEMTRRAVGEPVAG